jgi:hypothetical protein
MNCDNEQFPAIYADTRNEYAEIRRRIKEQDITIVKQTKNIFRIFEEVGVPLWSKDAAINIELASRNNFKDEQKYINKWASKKGSQWDFRVPFYYCKNNCVLCSDKCCNILKENILNENGARIVAFRKSEGGRRNKGKRKKEYDFCVKNRKELFKPILDITNSELAEMEKKLNIKTLNIYNYLERTGCVMCGFGTKKQLAAKINYLRWYEPQRAKFYAEYFKEYLKYRNIKF